MSEAAGELGVLEPEGTARRGGRRGLVWALLLLAAAIFFAHARLYWEWTEDDAFISFRYSKNLARGLGLVFNAGERVEGYSNFTWVLLGAAALACGHDPVLAAKGVGLASGLVTLVLAWRLALRLRPGSGLCALVAPYYLAISPVLVQHSVAGLETSLFAMLLAGSLLAATAGGSGRRRRALLVVLLLFLSLTRPEGPAVALLLLALRAALRGAGAAGPRAVAPEALAYAVVFGAYYAWRWGYFGAPFANTFHAKLNGGLRGLVDGAQYTLDFMRDGGGVAFVALALVPAFDGGRRAVYWMGLVLLVAYTALVVATGGDWMYHYRFFAHVLPVLAAWIAVGLERVLALGRPGPLRAALLYAAVAAVLLATLSSIGNTELRVARIVLPALRAHNYLSQNYEELGLWLQENSEPDAAVAISDVGAVGYFSERRILDMFGLIDPHIARLRGRMHFKADPRYVLSRAPDYVVLVSLNDQGAGYSFQRIPDYAMNALPEFHERYALIRTVPQHWHNEFVLVYRRRG